MLLLDWLIAAYPQAKRQTLRDMLAQGRVSVNGQRARSLKQEIVQADRVEVGGRPVQPLATIDPLTIIHEDDEILVVYKPAGLLTSTVERERRETAIAIIRDYLADRQPKARAGVIHRLDRDAAGLLVFSKNNEAYENLKHQFFHHTVERIYTAVVHGHPRQQSGCVDNRLVELTDGSMRPTGNPKKGQRAVTDYEVVRPVGTCALLRITLRTGRKHQIRAHMSELGHPIIGDTVYGRKGERGPLLLCATRLAFDHPKTGKRTAYEVPPPPEIQKMLS